MAEGRRADPRYVPVAGARREMREHVRGMWPARKPFPACFVAESGGTLVGYLGIQAAPPHPVVDRPPHAKISDLYVRPAARRTGVGRRLVETGLAAAEAAGYRHFDVGTLALDARAVAFWTSMGFGPWLVTLRRDPRG